MIVLPFGRRVLPLAPAVAFASRSWRLLAAAGAPGPAAPLDGLLDAALAAPIDRPPLAALCPPGARVTIIVSDGTRHEPRGALLAALRRHLPEVRLTVAVATGTHGPADLAALDLARDLPAGVHAVVNHDGHRDDDLVRLGTTAAGTPVRVHRCLLDADLVIATGCIRPHYFAGFGAGSKAIFPGLGAARDIRVNHAMKTLPGARAGRIDDNPCRTDLEDAARLLPTPTFLCNGVVAPDGELHAVVAGDPFTAFRAGAALARSWWSPAENGVVVGGMGDVGGGAPIVVASDARPVTDTLYQAAKIYAAMAPLVAPGGLLVVAAGCEDGIGPGRDPAGVVNEAILRIGVLPRLAAGVRLALVSTLPAELVRTTLVEPAASVAEAIAHAGAPAGDVLVVPRAAYLLLGR